jgi:hypothetical protein
MHRSLAAAGLLAGLVILAAGSARADCQPSEFCVDGTCRPILACGDVQPVSKAAATDIAAAPGKTGNSGPQVAATPAAAVQRPAPPTISRDELRNELRPMGTRHRQ